MGFKIGGSVGKFIDKSADRVKDAAAGAEDVVVGVATGDLDKAGEGVVDILKATPAGVIHDELMGVIGDPFAKPEDKTKPIAEELRGKQQELADVQRDESIRQQEEQATIARRNIFRQQVAENLATQQAQATAAASTGRFGSSFAQQLQASTTQQGAKTAFGAQFAQSEVDRQLAANLGFITQTSELGREISDLSQSLSEQQLKQAQAAQGIAGVIQGAVGGAGAGASFGPWGALAGGVIGAAAGGFSSGAFRL